MKIKSKSEDEVLVQDGAEVQIDGRRCWTLFDSGARNTYVVAAATTGLLGWAEPQPVQASLGGKVHHVSKGCMLIGTVENHVSETHARVVDDIGKDEKGRRIEILLGALAMQEWGIVLDLPKERLDFTHYPKEFVEF